jgi:ribosomal protein S18 acetylase RimI-like enzyme
VAELIEVCFASTLDEDGREYLRQMRWAARDMNYLAWMQGAAERFGSPLYGFVWEENGRIVGNLSLIPIVRRGKIIYLIANVAVHPEFRRRGIGHMLTQTALDHLRERGIDTVWLQVRDDNQVAHHLYLAEGFVERARRTAWQSSGLSLITRASANHISVQKRRPRDWPLQRRWLNEIYAPDIAWNLPLNPNRLTPGFWQDLFRWLQGETMANWVALQGDRPIGFLTWEPLRTSSDPLWLATNPRDEDQAIRALLPYARSMLSGKSKPLTVNYPAERAIEAFKSAGFFNYQTLIWMSINLR